MPRSLPASPSAAPAAAPFHGAPTARTGLRGPLAFAWLLAAVLLATLALRAPLLTGDAAEYTLMTVAVAEHGSPDIRPADVALGRKMMPQFDAALAQLADGMQAHREVPLSGFYRGREGSTQAIHFFGYSALAALPFKLLRALGADPFKCYQALNLACVFVLGLTLRHVFGSNGRAAVGLLLFLLCGGVLYLDWSSPELMTASMLLSGLLLYTAGSPLAAGLLGGLATLQNPTTVFFLAFAPLLQLVSQYRPGDGWRAALAPCVAPRRIAGLALGGALFALAPLYNLYQFGVPSVIAKVGADPAMASGVRLFSFYFDLNQGMIVAIPALAGFLLLWGWRRGAPGRGRRLAMLVLACVLTLALALPTLVIQNWNSGAAGVMRYAFWAAMPLLFVLLWQLRRLPRWPVAALAVLLVLQGLAMRNDLRYGALEFSPLARAVLRHAPAWYNPEPELFAERSWHGEYELAQGRVAVYEDGGKVYKTMYSRANLDADQALCGAGRALTAANRFHDTTRMWRYIDGQPQCGPAGPAPLRYGLAQFLSHDGITLGTGWSQPESGGDIWNGSWSNGKRSVLTVPLPAGHQYRTLLIIGHYFTGNSRTRVIINGRDLGWFALRELPELPLPDAPTLTLELEHDAPYQPPPGQPDTRQLAFFLQEIALKPALR
ncbi:hypothetical protein H3H37_23390 [Duganella sp. LX20W]|uniref:Uncharacterized protein n=1 Tax=Rugamonas brunnea TaxID=2758569 RepID=A0A7W2EWT9_9BURK|nr:hypothetical protein [Rugamonas brunnea]MBA5640010.1 hypothetical protein [Rugamonas brunnea]